MELTRDRISVERAWDMMLHIPANDREIWLKVGMALHSEFAEAGFALWDEWSRTASNYDKRAAQSVWRSFKGSGIGAGTLVYLAKSHGWQPYSGNRNAPLPRHKPAPVQITGNTTAYALRLWLAATRNDQAVASHPYANAKGIQWAAGAARGNASGRIIGRDADCLIIPVRVHATGKIQGVQAINPDGKKQSFGQISGGCLVLGNTLNKTSIPWYVAEGWASATSVVFHHHDGNAVCAASFGKSNMEQTAEILADVFKPYEITILEEVDQ